MTNATRRLLIAAPLLIASPSLAQPSRRPYGLVGDGWADDTEALQRLFDSARFSKTEIPVGMFRITRPIQLDAECSYSISGQAADPNGKRGTVIVSDSPAGALKILGSKPGVDNFIQLTDFTIRGLKNSGTALATTWVHGLKLERLWITSNGGHGIELSDSWSCKLTNVVVAHSGGDGIRIMRRGNLISLRDCTFNGSGDANIRISGSAPNESLAVTLDSCDFSSAPTGLILEHVWSARVIGCYSEGCPTLVRADATVRGLTFQGNYLQDGTAIFDRVEALNLGENTFNAQALPTTLRLRLAKGSRLGSNHFARGAKQVIDPT